MTRFNIAQCGATVAFLLAFAGCVSHNSQVASADSARNASQLLTATVQAHGGEHATRPPASLRRLSRVVILPPGQDPLEGQLLYLSLGPVKERLELATDSGGYMVQIFDGERAAEWIHGQRSDHDPTREAKRRRTYRNILSWMQEPGLESCRYVGIEEVSDQPQWVLERLFQEDETWRIFVDTESHLISRILCSFHEGDQSHIREDWLFDYRDINGKQVPHRQVTVFNGLKVCETWLLEYEENAPLDAGFFSLKSFPQQ